MKKTEMIFLVFIMLAVSSCATVGDIKSSVSTKVTAMTANVDPGLVAKVPADKRGGFLKAQFDVTVAEEQLKLAQMKSELAAKQENYVGYEEDMANISLKEVNLDYDIVKLQAVDASGLGKKEDNIKTLTNLKLKKVNLQTDRIKADANMADVKKQMNVLSEKIKAQEAHIKGLALDKETPEAAREAAKEKLPVKK